MIALLLAPLLGIGQFSSGDRPAVELAEGDEAYRAGLAERADSAKARPHLLRAAGGYEAAWARGPRTASLARNMAQSRYLAGDLGRSIRDYRRGLKEFPHDPDLRRGLAFVRGRVEYPLVGDLPEATRPRDPPSLLDRLPVPIVRLAVLTVGLWAVGWFVLARAWVTARGGLAVVGALLVLGALGTGGWLWWEDGRLRARWGEPAAVVVAPTEVRAGNSNEYPRRIEGRLPTGVEVRVLGERGKWVHVELADGTAGWVPAGRMARVE